MNYHSDEWIMAGLQRHYDEVLTIYRLEQVVGIMYTGSANYNADCENSDVDSWAIVVEEHYDPATYEVQMHRFQDEIIWFCDIRAFINGLSFSDFWYLQALYTKYKIINPQYKNLVDELYNKREEYAYNNIQNFVDLISQRMDFVDIKYFDTELDAHKREKALYYSTIMYIGLLIYKYHEPFESLFYNEYYAAHLLKIKNGNISYEEGKKLYITMAMAVKQFKSSLKDYPSNNNLFTFSEQIMQDFIQKYKNEQRKF